MRVPVSNGCYKAFSDLIAVAVQATGLGEILIPSAFYPHLPPNFASSDTVLAGEPSYVESEFCGKLMGKVALGAVGWALVLEVLLGQ